MSRYIVWFILLLFPYTLQAEDQVFTLGLEEWSLPRSGQAVTGFVAVRAAVQAWEARPGSQLQLRYPGGEEGSLWAQELSDWLISLGIGAESIDIVPGSPFDDQLEIALVGGGGLQ